jgi:hypothetical protein
VSVAVPIPVIQLLQVLTVALAAPGATVLTLYTAFGDLSGQP